MTCSNCGVSRAAQRPLLPRVRQRAPGELPQLRLAAARRRQVLRGVRHADRRRRRQRRRRPRSPANAGAPTGPIAERRLVSILFADLVGFTTLVRGPRRRGDARAPVALLRACRRGHRPLRRHDREVHRRRRDGRLGRADRARERRRARGPRRARPRGRGQDPRPRDQRARRRADRRGGGDDRRHEPGHGRRRHRQHRVAPPVGRPARHGARRRVDGARGEPGDRVRARGRPGPQGQAGAGARRSARSASSPSAAAAAGATSSRRRSSAATASSRCSRTSSTPPAASGGRGSCRSSGSAGSGKSRLIWELSKYLDGVVETVWWHAGRSPAYGEGITFWALGEMVRSRAGLAETDDEPTTRAKVAEAIERWVPDESRAALDRNRAATCSWGSTARPRWPARSCSRRGGRSSSGSPPRARSCWCSRTSIGPTRARSTSSTTSSSGAGACRSS